MYNKTPVQEILSNNLQRHWMSNIRRLFIGLVHLSKIVRQSKNEMCCGANLKIAMVIKKKQIFREYHYHWILHHTQDMLYPAANDCLYVSIYGNTRKNQCQSFCWKFLHENFIIAWRVLQKKVDWNNQGTKTIILSSVIQPYKISATDKEASPSS